MRTGAIITYAGVFVILLIYLPILILLMGWMLIHECVKWAMREKR